MKCVDASIINFTLEHLPTPVIWFDLEGNVRSVNQAMALSLGYAEQEFKNFSIFNINPLINKITWNQWKHQLSRKQRLVLNTQHYHQSGQAFPVEISLSLVTLNQQEFIFLTAKNRADEERFKNLFELTEEMAHVGAWDWNLVTGEVNYTDEIVKIFGASPNQQLTPELAIDLCEEAHGENVQAALQRAIQEGESFEMKVAATNLKGEKQNVFVSALPQVFDGQVVKLIGILQKVTSSNESELFLEMKGFTIEEVSDMVFWVNYDGKFIFVNNAVADAHGIEKEKFLKKYVWDIAPRVDEESWRERWDRFRKTKHLEYESIHRREDGSEFPVDVSINFLEFKDEEYICAVLRDVTLKKQKEEELNRLKDLLQAENEYLQEDIRLQHSFTEIITVCKEYQLILQQIEQVATLDTTVLILGETGTGKELLARAVHKLSNRNPRALIKINCANLPANLIESELFGHEKGAFTGAEKTKIGRFELADGGTIFLDEIGEMPLELQSKLLRVLQEGEFSRLGGNETIKTDVRILAATNRNLEKLVEEGKFREDLYYRLNVFPIENLPLRERKNDIPVLANHFMKKFSEKSGRKVDKISQRAMNKLINYNFPGNIRELENIIERSIVLSNGSSLNLDHWHIKKKSAKNGEFLSFEEIQKVHILKALKKADWRVSGKGGAAELLKLNAKTLDSKMRKFGINRRDYMEK
ncbi:MAG: sigma 54-interacting transcriptional regulator [Bacteroidota bacterium]